MICAKITDLLTRGGQELEADSNVGRGEEEASSILKGTSRLPGSLLRDCPSPSQASSTFKIIQRSLTK